MRQFRHLLFIIGSMAALLAGCAPVSAATATPAPVCDPSQTPDFTDYLSWTLVNDHPVPGHETLVNIYVDNLAKDIYLNASGALFPAFTRIVKTHLMSATSADITGIAVMAKMPPGFDPAHNDWWWGMFTPDGKTALMSGKVDACIECHQKAADADYVFSNKVMNELKK